MKKVYKYGTGQEIPDDAVYLWSTTEHMELTGLRFVWHYFLVDIEG